MGYPQRREAEASLVVQVRGVVPIYLVLRNISQNWTMPVRSWKAAMIHFAILFPEAFDEAAD